MELVHVPIIADATMLAIYGTTKSPSSALGRWGVCGCRSWQFQNYFKKRHRPRCFPHSIIVHGPPELLTWLKSMAPWRHDCFVCCRIHLANARHGAHGDPELSLLLSASQSSLVPKYCPLARWLLVAVFWDCWVESLNSMLDVQVESLFKTTPPKRLRSMWEPWVCQALRTAGPQTFIRADGCYRLTLHGSLGCDISVLIWVAFHALLLCL